MAKLAEGQASFEQLTINHGFDAQFWRGLEMIERENLDDLHAMTVAAEALYDGQKGGAR